MTLLAEIVAVSRRVTGTPSRLAKIAELAACLRALDASEIPVALSYLSGEIPQGRLGIAWSELQQGAGNAPADHPALTLEEADAAFGALAATKGKGASAARAAHLARLFSLATADEADFLARLIVGELRQGAL